MNTILIAPDSFKGSLSAQEAADAIELGVRRVLPEAAIVKLAVSDGGEGLVEILSRAWGGTIQQTEVSGPLPDQRVNARWGLSRDRSIAIIEMAEAAGLMLVPAEKQDLTITTTYGVGQLIRETLDAGVRSLIIGIGGSATNDGGAGMAEALGVRFLDDLGKPLERGGAALARLGRIDVSRKDERISNVSITVACDVQNPLCGEQGASVVFGPQKGASQSDVRNLDNALRRYGEVIRQTLSTDVLSLPGGGAAGGLGAGLVAFCNAQLKRGIDVVLNTIGFDDHLRGAGLVLTGEGKLDEQVRFGKAVAGIVERAHRFHVPVVAVVGSVHGDRSAFVTESFLADLESLVDADTTIDIAMEQAAALLSLRTQSLFRRFVARKGL